MSSLADPFNSRWTGVRVFRPRSVTARLTHQSGLFTIHEPPSLSVEDALLTGQMARGARLRKIVIPGGLRRQCRLALLRYGIDRSLLFGDLDGLSRQMAWEMQNLDAWDTAYVDNDFGLDTGGPEKVPLPARPPRVRRSSRAQSDAAIRPDSGLQPADIVALPRRDAGKRRGLPRDRQTQS
jgi:hypothetical protein